MSVPGAVWMRITPGGIAHLLHCELIPHHIMLCPTRPSHRHRHPRKLVLLCPLSEKTVCRTAPWGRALVFAILLNMGILIGMDEAGYGPNFGPLVVAATAWHVSDEASYDKAPSSINTPPYGEPASAGGEPSALLATAIRPITHKAPHHEIDLYRILRSIVAKSASERRVAIADSKSLYHPGLGLRQLERGVHTVLRAMGQQVSRWSTMLQYCGADPERHHQRVCWPENHDCPLPIDTTAEELTRLSTRFARACESANVRPLLIRARLVFPAEFNDLVSHYGTKGAALSHITVGLLRDVTDSICNPQPLAPSHAAAVPPQPPIFAVCDKHGGRNFYASLLQHHFSEHWIEPIYESSAESRYEWGPPESRVRVAFRTKGERYLPTALASMTAKYLRELAMRAFNTFWAAHVPDLRPTAGYPTDAHRFRKAIAAAQRKLKINDHALWRNR